MKVLIQGMGVIGREVFRLIFGAQGYEIVGINDPNFSAAMLAYLLSHDSVYGEYPTYNNESITSDDEFKPFFGLEARSITVESTTIPLFNVNALELPLGDMGVDVVIICQGAYYNTKDKAMDFIRAGARKVMLCTYAGTDLKYLAYGLNNSAITAADVVISVGNIESQVMAFILNVLEPYATSIKTGAIRIFEAYTNAQHTMDSYDYSYLPAGRAAAANISPRSLETGPLGLILPTYSGADIDIKRYSVPIPVGGIADFTIELNSGVTEAQIETAIGAVANESFGVSEELLCSSDAIRQSYACVVPKDSIHIHTVNGKNVCCLNAVFDNIRGFAMQIVRSVSFFSGL